MVEVKVKQAKDIDFSFMPTLECNLECPHCMYDVSPENIDILNYDFTKEFVNTFDWEQINSCGFYGGEPSINLDLYKKYINLIPEEIPKFMITNGNWSVQWTDLIEFVNYIMDNNIQVFVSSSPYHIEYQNEKLLAVAIKAAKGLIQIKDEDELFLPMGRLAEDDWTCTKKCLRWNKPMRLALQPSGNVIYQGCDGVYPIIGTYYNQLETLIEFIKNKRFCDKLLQE
jgi:hypothetical protein